MTKTADDALDIMRRVIGENDGQDPNATQVVLLGYLSDFYNLVMPQDIKFYSNWSYVDFVTVADQDVYPLNTAPLPIGEFVNFAPPAFIYLSGGVQDNVKMWWYQDPNAFFTTWPIDTSNLGTGKPTDILFYDNKITLRTVPDKAYNIRMIGYKNNGSLTDTTDELVQDYIWRYVAYGAAIDWLSDFGQYEELQKVMPMFRRYRDIVLRRTAVQLANQQPYIAVD